MNLLQIELVWAEAKAYLTRHQRSVSRLDPYVTIHRALSTVTLEHCQHMVKHCSESYTLG